ncbi:MAG: hypothetical protein HON55_05250 [Legionellales bacterium]|jgi:hypothetical protein|nr:hypothetical protein [Legionellales bacterium]
MNMTNKQRVNFLEVLPVRYDMLPSFTHILIVWGLLCAGFYMQHLYAGNSHSKLLSHGDKLNAKLDKALASLSEGGANFEGGKGRGKLVAITDDKLNLNKVGFYGDLRSLALNYSDKVWFTSISINNKDGKVTLLGRTSSTSALNKLFTKLTALDEFKDYSMNLRDIVRVESKDSGGVLHAFIISNDSDVKSKQRRR